MIQKPPAPPSSATEVYFAAKTGQDLADEIVARAKDWDAFLEKAGELAKMRDAAAAYVGEDMQGFDTATIGRTGAQGQMAVLKTNVVRPSVQNVITFTASQPPGILPVPKNTDHTSQAAALIAKGIADHYRDEQEVEEAAKEALEAALVLTRAAISVVWDEDAGREREDAPEEALVDLLEPDPSEFMGGTITPPLPAEMRGMDLDVTTLGGTETAPAAEPLPVFQEVREGDSRVRVHEPQDCMFNPRARTAVLNWRILRVFESRWEMAAKYGAADPEVAEHILGWKPPAEKVSLRQDWIAGETDRFNDEIPVLEFYHAKTKALPEGKCAVIIGGRVVKEGPLKYHHFPVYELRAGKRFSTAFAHSPTTDVLSMSKAIDTLTSIPYSNMRATGGLTLLARANADVQHKVITEGLAKLTYAGEHPPEYLEVPQTPSQFFEYRKDLISESRNQYGLDNFSAGADVAKMSGAAYTMLDSRTLRALQSTVGQWVGAVRFIYNALLHNLQTFAKGSRTLPLMVGKQRAAFIKEFESTDIEPIDRYAVEMISPVMRTTSGRIEVGNNLLATKAANGGPGISPEQYVALIETGKLETMTEAPMMKLQNIRAENERLLRGEKLDMSPEEEMSLEMAAQTGLPPMDEMGAPLEIEQVATVAILDNDWEHIQEHRMVGDSPEARSNPVVMRNLNDHIAKHLENARMKDPGLLAILGQPPLPTMMPMMGGDPSMTGAPEQGGPSAAPPPAGAAEGAPENGASTPRAPMNPQTGERYEGQPAPTAADLAVQ